MTPEEVGRVLAAAAARDNRTVGQVDVMAWWQDIGDLDPADALAAVSRHYRETTDRLMPAHVRRIAIEIDRDRRRVHRESLERAAIAAEEADPTRRDRSAEVQALLDDLRERLTPGRPDVLRRPEWVENDKRRDREARAEPNPAFTGPPPAGGHPLPDEGDAA